MSDSFTVIVLSVWLKRRRTAITAKGPAASLTVSGVIVSESSGKSLSLRSTKHLLFICRAAVTTNSAEIVTSGKSSSIAFTLTDTLFSPAGITIWLRNEKRD